MSGAPTLLSQTLAALAASSLMVLAGLSRRRFVLRPRRPRRHRS
jgi:hypothetical protein